MDLITEEEAAGDQLQRNGCGKNGQNSLLPSGATNSYSETILSFGNFAHGSVSSVAYQLLLPQG